MVAPLVALAVLWSSPPDAAAAPPAPASAAATSAAIPPPGPPLSAIWGALDTPSPGPAQAIGGCAAGCLQGGEALGPTGPGYEVLHLSRKRFYGHPELLAYLRRLGAAAKKQHLAPLIVGDLSQARGGPTPSGHHSHQSGLDADLGFAPPQGLRPGRLKRRDRERLGPPAVVDLRTHKMKKPWGPRVVRLLALAADDPAVDRIFVNPAIKRALCATPVRSQPWMARLRPWWGHHDHFHVRLKCPAESPLCQPQDPITADDGCGPTLAWWFTDDAQTTHERREHPEQHPEQPAPRGPTLPRECDALLPAPPATPATPATAAAPSHP